MKGNGESVRRWFGVKKEKEELEELPPEIYNALGTMAVRPEGDALIAMLAGATMKMKNRLGLLQCFILLKILQELRRGRA
jgi:hypothetical protein